MVAIAEALLKRGYDIRIMALWPLQPDEPNIEQEIIKIGLQPHFWSDFVSSVKRSQWSRCPNTLGPNWSGLPRWFVEKAHAVELAIRQFSPSVVHAWLDLPGMIAAQTWLPVLGVPVESRALKGLDSLLSIAQMPAGVAVGTLAIGVAGAKNAGLLAASIIGLRDTKVRDAVQKFRQRQTKKVLGQKLP